MINQAKAEINPCKYCDGPHSPKDCPQDFNRVCTCKKRVPVGQEVFLDGVDVCCPVHGKAKGGGKTSPPLENWEEEYRRELNLKYELLGVSKQPKGNREQWIEADIILINRVRAEATKAERERIIKAMPSKRHKITGEYKDRRASGFNECRNIVMAILNPQDNE